MKKIYIFGMGKGKAYLERCLIKKDVRIIGFVNNFKTEAIKEADGVPVISQNQIKEECDYVVISLMQYAEVRDSLLKQGIGRNKVISFFDWNDADNETNWNIFDPYKWRMELIWQYYKGTLLPITDNMNYEIYSGLAAMKECCPKIMDIEHSIALLWREKKCLARFGDGEFEIMRGRTRAIFQDTDAELGERLKEVLHSRVDNLSIAIADNYGSLGQYTDEAAKDIRLYLTKEVRQDHMKLLELDRQYYNAYLSRPYMIYRDKAGAENRFCSIKKIWEKEDVLIVEGAHTRFGVGNDLLENALHISRIVVPDKNAFSKYKEILEKTRKYGEGKLILAVLGPTATVLAYDLARENDWIIDIGQLDIEYEWYLRGVKKRCAISHKYVSEIPEYENRIADGKEKDMKKYESEIIARIL